MAVKQFVLIVAAALSLSAHATSVASYDIANANASGLGGWDHSYTGTITAALNGLVNYSGGSGTLNDGVVPDSSAATFNNELFLQASAPTITLHLDGLTKISTIEIYGGDTGSTNYIPGTLTGWTVAIGGQSVALTSIGFGSPCLDVLCNAQVNLSGTSLENIETDTVTLSNFQGGWNGYFSAAEVTVNSSASPVPEASRLALTSMGIGLIGFMIRRRK